MKTQTGRKRNILIRGFKWMAFTILCLFFLAVGTTTIILQFHQDKIKAVFIGELNKHLRSEVTSGDVSLSLFKHFPFATIRFTDIVAKDAIKKERKGDLFHAKSLQLTFNLIDLYFKHYKVRRMDVDDAVLNIKLYADLSDNYHFWKPADVTPAGGLQFDLQKVSLRNVDVHYYNFQDDWHFFFSAKEASFRGEFSDEKFALKAGGKFVSRLFRFGELTVLQNRNADVDFVMDVDQNTGTYIFRKGIVNLDQLNFVTEGNVVHNDMKKFMDIKIQSDDASLKDLQSVLPAKHRKALEEYGLKGQMTFSMRIKGSYAGKSHPVVSADFSLSNGNVRKIKGDISLEEITASGSFKGGDAEHLPFLSLDNFSSRLGKGKINGRVSCIGLEHPLLEFIGTANIDLSELSRFLQLPSLTRLEGKLDINLNFRGKLKTIQAFSQDDFFNSQVSGTMSLSQFGLEIKDNPVQLKNTTAAFSFNRNDVVFDEMKGRLNDFDFTMSGSFSNILPYLFIQGEKISIDASLQAPRFDLASFVALGKTEGGTAYRLEFPDFIEGDIRLKFDRLDFERFSANELAGEIEYFGKQLFINNLTFNSFSGKTETTASIKETKSGDFEMNVQSGFTGVNIKQLFYQMSNFGQNFLADKNLKGTGSGLIRASFLMDSGLNISAASLVSSANLIISNGELIDFKPIQGLGKFIRVDDLSHVRFSTLKNEILIRDQKIIIPEMDVVSDAISFKIAGIHTFKQEIDYHIQVLLSDLLFRKAKSAKKENEEFGIEMDDGSHRTTLFIRLTGTVDKPVFRYDSKGVKGKIVSSYLNEKENLKTIFNKEFQRTQKTRDSIYLQEKDDMKKQESGQFLIEWEGKRMDSIVKKPAARKLPDKGRQKKEKPEFKVDWE